MATSVKNNFMFQASISNLPQVLIRRNDNKPQELSKSVTFSISPSSIDRDEKIEEITRKPKANCSGDKWWRHRICWFRTSCWRWPSRWLCLHSLIIHSLCLVALFSEADTIGETLALFLAERRENREHKNLRLSEMKVKLVYQRNESY